MKNTLIIIAAGNSSRMGSLPKAVLSVGGVPNLENTVQIGQAYFDKIYVVANNKTKNIYESVLKRYNVTIFDIESGLGCGDAILKALTDKRINLETDNILLCWGDTYFPTGRIFSEMIKSETKSNLSIGVKFEEDPYAWFETKEDKITGVRFKKRGHISRGLVPHDQSIFKVKKEIIEDLSIMKNVLWRENHYLQGEMIFLDLVFYLSNIKKPAVIVELTDRSYSYNTEEDLEKINTEIKK